MERPRQYAVGPGQAPCVCLSFWSGGFEKAIPEGELSDARFHSSKSVSY